MHTQIRILTSICVLLGVFSLNTFAAPLSEEPHRLLYQIYPESFFDTQNTQITKPSQKRLRQNYDGHGDLQGIEVKLDYLQYLGVSGILLMPIFEAEDGMGYIPKDFFKLRSDYTLGKAASPAEREAVLRGLIHSAHSRGIKIFLDAPVNHIAKNSDWFRASEIKASGFESDFLWADHPLEGWRIPWEPQSKPTDVWNYSTTRNAWYYALFGWGMPEFNHRNPKVVAEFDRFFSHYASLGVDGFRVDAAKHLLEGHTNLEPAIQDNILLLRHYLTSLRSRFSDQSFLLEIWSGYDEIEAFPRESGDVKFDFPYLGALRDSLKWSHPYGVRNILKHFEDTQDHILPGERIIFAGNHDVARLRTEVENDRPRGELGLALTLSLPFTSMIYYGDEIGMLGRYIRFPGHPQDNINEACMPMLWTPGPNAGFTGPEIQMNNAWNKMIQPDWPSTNVETQMLNPQSLLRVVQTLSRFRADLGIDSRVRFKVDRRSNDDPVLRISFRLSNGSCVVGLYNFSNQRQNQLNTSFPGFCLPHEKNNNVALGRRVYQRELERVDLDPYGFYLLWVR